MVIIPRFCCITFPGAKGVCKQEVHWRRKWRAGHVQEEWTATIAKICWHPQVIVCEQIPPPCPFKCTLKICCQYLLFMLIGCLAYFQQKHHIWDITAAWLPIISSFSWFFQIYLQENWNIHAMFKSLKISVRCAKNDGFTMLPFDSHWHAFICKWLQGFDLFFLWYIQGNKSMRKWYCNSLGRAGKKFVSEGTNHPKGGHIASPLFVFSRIHLVGIWVKSPC